MRSGLLTGISTKFELLAWNYFQQSGAAEWKAKENSRGERECVTGASPKTPKADGVQCVNTASSQLISPDKTYISTTSNVHVRGEDTLSSFI